MKIDDDSFLNLPKLLSDLSSQTQTNLGLNKTNFDYFVMGYLFQQMQVAYSNDKIEMTEKYSRKWKTPTYMCNGRHSRYSKVNFFFNCKQNIYRHLNCANAFIRSTGERGKRFHRSIRTKRHNNKNIEYEFFFKQIVLFCCVLFLKGLLFIHPCTIKQHYRKNIHRCNGNTFKY